MRSFGTEPALTRRFTLPDGAVHSSSETELIQDVGADENLKVCITLNLFVFFTLKVSSHPRSIMWGLR